MRNHLLIAVLFSSVMLHSAAANPYFAMSYGFGEIPPAEQTAWLAEAGFDGIAVHVWNDELFARLEQVLASEPVASGRLRVVGIYFPFTLTNPEHRPLASRILHACHPHGSPLWISAQAPGATDEKVVALLRDLCDEAASLGLDVIYYPHDNHHCLDSEHALRLIETAGRTNLYNSLHLHQELRAGHASRLPEIVARVLPRTRLVSISGANASDRVNRHSNDWSDVVRPLAQSVFDVGGFYRLILRAGYEGPVGLQNWRIPGDPRLHHAESLRLLQRWSAEVGTSQPDSPTRLE